jgi:hypothetical protein
MCESEHVFAGLGRCVMLNSDLCGEAGFFLVSLNSQWKTHFCACFMAMNN